MVEVVQGHRTFAEQDGLYAQGRTKPGKKVTNARGGQSNHNYGLAVDFCIFENGQPNWNAPYEKWEAIGEAAEALGLEWGGRWKSFRDLPHVQLPGLSVAQCRALHDKGGLPLVWQRASAVLQVAEIADVAPVQTLPPAPTVPPLGNFVVSPPADFAPATNTAAAPESQAAPSLPVQAQSTFGMLGESRVYLQSLSEQWKIGKAEVVAGISAVVTWIKANPEKLTIYIGIIAGFVLLYRMWDKWIKLQVDREIIKTHADPTKTSVVPDKKAR